MQRLGKFVAGALAAAAAITLSACGVDDTVSGSSTTTAAASSATTSATTVASKGRACTAEDIKTTGAFGAVPTITVPDSCDPPRTLIVKDLAEGTGDGAKPGQQLTMNYALVTWSDKQKKDSSFDRGEPFTLALGAGQVIPGWDQGLVGIKQGGRRLLIIPSELGYGQGGNGIKPGETLVFVTDAVTVPKA